MPLDEIAAKAAEAPSNLLSRQRGRVRDVVRQGGGPLFAPHMDYTACSSVWGDKCNIKVWQDLAKIAGKGSSSWNRDLLQI